MVVAAKAWGTHWATKYLLTHCDNHTLVDIQAAATTKNEALMHLVRERFLTAVKNNITVILSTLKALTNACSQWVWLVGGD